MDQQTKASLIQAAREAMETAYCPYSQFAVGAAILTDQGRVVKGCNVENASFGLTICAERTAMTRCIAEEAGKPIAIAVTAKTEAALSPCGACRQFLAEFNPRMIVLLAGEKGFQMEISLEELLPHAFCGKTFEK